MSEIIVAPVMDLTRSELAECAQQLSALGVVPEVAGLLDERGQAGMVERLRDPDAVQSWLVTAQDSAEYGSHNVAVLMDVRAGGAVGYGIRQPGQTFRDMGSRVPAVERLARRMDMPASLEQPGGSYVFAWGDNRRPGWLGEMTLAYDSLAKTTGTYRESVPSWTLEPQQTAVHGIRGAITGAGFSYLATGRYQLGDAGRGGQEWRRLPKSDLFVR